MLGQIAFQIPQVVGLADLIRLSPYFLHDLVQLPFQSGVANCAGDSLFRPRPNGFVLVGIAVSRRRRAAHLPILFGGILSLARVPFLRLCQLHSPERIPSVSLAAVRPLSWHSFAQVSSQIMRCDVTLSLLSRSRPCHPG